MLFLCKLPDPAQKPGSSQNHHQISDLPQKTIKDVDSSSPPATNQHFGWYPIQGFDDFRCESHWFWRNSSPNLLRKKYKQLTFIKHPKKKSTKLSKNTRNRKILSFIYCIDYLPTISCVHSFVKFVSKGKVYPM